MDADRFDSLVRALTDTRSRRDVLRGLLAASLGLLGWSAAEDATAKECKKIKDKKKRKKCLKKAAACRPNCAGRVCGDDGCGGTCGTCAHVPCQDVCQGGACLSANDSPCIFGGRCLNGTCNPNPMCGGGGVSICSPANPEACCSKVCNNDICAPGFPGDECTVRTDCNGVGCIGFRCQ